MGGKLNIESLQDEERFKTKSSGGGLEVEFGFGNNWSLSGYGNASKGTTHRKQVNEQAGIFAEEGGYHINADSVHLKGGAIASTNPKNSELATNKLTFEDIQNESSSKAASASISGNLKESKEKWVDNETGRAVKPNTENSTQLDSQRSGGISPGLPMFEQEVRRLKSRLEKAEQQGSQEVVNQLKKDLMQAEAQAENWGTGGSTKRAVDAITNAGLIALSGGSSQSIATAAASPYVNQLIKKATEDYPALNIPTHILWGAVEAELMGGKASTGAISTAAGELGAKYLTEHLYNKEAKDLTETERSQVKEMAKALAGVAGGLAAAGQGASAVKVLSESSIGTTVAHNAVENNFLSDASRARLNALKTKYHRGEKLTNKEKLEFRDLIESDQRSDILLDKFRKDPNSLNSKEREAFLSYVDRYYIETVTGNTASGYKLASPTSLVNAQNRFESEYLINDPVPKRDYGHFPFAGTDAQRSQAVNTLPEESKNWLGWRSEKHSRDEEMYYAVKNELDAPENYKNSANGKIAYSVKDGLESASMIYGVGVLSNALSKVPATVNALNLPNKVVSATAKVGDFAKAHPILTEKVVNSGTSMGFTYLGNSLSGKETSMSDLAWSAGTGFAAGGTKFGTTLAINTVSSGMQANYEGKDPLYKMGATAGATILGAGAGKLLEKAGYRALAGDVSRNKDYYAPQNRNQKFYDLLNGEYKSVSARFGTIGDSSTSEYLNQKLEKNEGNIKNWVKGVPNNE